MDALLTAVARAVAKKPILVLLALVLSFAPTVWLSSKLDFESSLTALLPQDYRAVSDLNKGIERTGGSAFAVVAVDARDRPAAERYAMELAKRLEKEPYVRFVQARIDLEFLKDRALLYLTPERLKEITGQVAEEIDARTVEGAGLGLDLGEDEEAKTSSTSSAAVSSFDIDERFRREAKALNLPSSPFMAGNDGRYLYVFVALQGNAGDIGGARKTQASMERVAYELRDTGGFPKDMELRFTGSLVIRIEEDEILKRDLSTASVLGFVAVVMLLVIYTRRPRTLLLLGAPLFIGITWTFAFAQLAIGRLNIISGFLASILSGLGIEFGIHLLLRYLEERQKGASIEEANAESMRTTGRSLVGSALTNAGAFFVISFAGFKGFSEFGVIAGVGMLLTLFATLLGFPAVLIALERLRPMKIRHAPEEAERGIHVPRVARTAILVGMVAFFGFSVFQLAMGKVRFRTNWREIKGESRAADFDDYMLKTLGATFTQSLILVDDRAHIPEVLKVLDEHIEKRKAAGHPSGVIGTLSANDLVPPDQEARLAEIAELRKQLERIKPERLNEKDQELLARAKRLAEVKPFDLADVPRSLKQRLETLDGKGSLIVLRTAYRFYESSEIVDWANEIEQLRDELDAAKLATPVISENWIAGTVFKIIFGDGPFILIATLIVVFAILFLDFRSVPKAAVVLGSLLIGLISMAGAMGIVGLELNFINAAVLPIVVGVSIDNAVHIYHRWLEEGPGSIPLVLRHTVSATALSSATNLMGFGAMIVAHHRGLRSVAELAILGVGLTFFSTSIFFPLALQAWSERRAKKAAA